MEDCVCLDEAALEGFASGSGITPARAMHVSSCESCRRRLEEIESDNAFIAEYRSANAGGHTHWAPVADATIEGYRLVDEIGRGGQGVVFRAIDERAGRFVALKLLRAGAASSFHRRRFDREIEIVAGLRHPGIVTLYEALDTADGGRAISMEYVDGLPFDRWCAERRAAEGPLSVSMFNGMLAVCDAVQYAHLHGVIHRDLKPANIIVDHENMPRVLDFGVARSEAVFDESTFTVGFVGSPGYAAPEQIVGPPKDVDVRCDIFALGAIVYQAITSHLPFPNRPNVASLSEHVRDERAPTAASTLVALGHGVRTRDVDAVLAKALACEPERRYQSVAELREDLIALREGGPVRARPDGISYIARRAMRKHRWAVTISAATAVAMLASTVAFAALWRGAAERAKSNLSVELIVSYHNTLRPRIDQIEAMSQHDRDAVASSAGTVESIIIACGNDAVREASLRHGWAHLLSNAIGDHAKAIAFARGALQLRERALGSNDRSTLSTLELIAVLESRAGHLIAAIKTADDLRDRTRAIMPPDAEEVKRVSAFCDIIAMQKAAVTANAHLQSAEDALGTGDFDAARKAIEEAQKPLQPLPNITPD
ncbi:MAG: serine/threonine-protein kinase [Phycisphaerae bacterium]|nr:serine/threonine-protein kinase [Phycisphaerae bacterium]